MRFWPTTNASGEKDPDEIVTTHARTVQCDMQFDYSDYSSGRLDFRSQLFLRPIATVYTQPKLSRPWGEPVNEAVGGWE